MNDPSGSEKDVMATLKMYKKLTERNENHAYLLKEKTGLLFTASLLELNGITITTLCLDILNDLIANIENHTALIMTFGIFEALESTSIRLRAVDEEQAHRASEMVDVLRRNIPPAYGTRTRVKQTRQKRNMTKMYQLYIPLLQMDTQQDLHNTLINIKGLVSFVVDAEQQKCTLRLSPKLTVDMVIETVFKNTGMKALLVTKCRNDINEVYVDIFSESNKKCGYPEYLPEDDTPPKGKSLADAKNFTKTTGGWFKTFSNFLSDSFYW